MNLCKTFADKEDPTSEGISISYVFRTPGDTFLVLREAPDVRVRARDETGGVR